MKRNNLDAKLLDFTWKQNRLSKDKEALKNSMLDVIRKKPKDKPETSIMPRESGIAGAAQLTGASGMNQGEGYGQTMGMQQAPAAYQNN